MQTTTTICVDNLCCASEEQLVRKSLELMPGVQVQDINIVTKKIRVSYTGNADSILQNLKRAGLEVHLQVEITEKQSSWLERNRSLALLALSSGFLVGGIACSLFHLQENVIIPLYVLAILLSGWNVIKKGIASIRLFSLDMNFLMMIATAGALTIGKWEEGAAVMFLFSVAELLEEYSMKRTRTAISSLMNLSPPTTTIKENGIETVVAVESVNIGERFVVRPGERIPLDGVVVSGESSVNQAPITGESAPVRKQIGELVFAGSYNERGALEVESTKAYYDTVLSRIVRSVEEAQANRAPLQNLVDRFARIYTPVVFGIAIVTAIIPPLFFQLPFGEWFYRALVLLVIACPCALVISTPITIITGLTNASRNGVLIKGGKYLEILSSIKAIAFDKTGTLTQGMPHVTDVITLNSHSTGDILRIAALVEQQSEHHLAAAVVQKAMNEQLTTNSMFVTQFESLTGKGVRATIEGTEYIVGNHALIEEMKICSSEVETILTRLESEGKTAIILAEREQPLGIIAIADTIRTDARSLVNRLHVKGIEKIIMLTGDNEGTARSVAAQTGIDEYYAGILPEEKVAFVQKLKERFGNVAVVGDGMNDAPALAAATVGVAMGKSGTDITLESADVVLMSDELSKLPYLISLSKRTLSIIKQNIVIAIVTKLVFLVLGMFGMATLWMAVIADDGATLIVILNGLRLLQWNNNREEVSVSSRQQP